MKVSCIGERSAGEGADPGRGNELSLPADSDWLSSGNSLSPQASARSNTRVLSFRIWLSSDSPHHRPAVRDGSSFRSPPHATKMSAASPWVRRALERSAGADREKQVRIHIERYRRAAQCAGWIRAQKRFQSSSPAKCRPIAAPNAIGTALPICRAISIFDPMNRYSSGNPWSVAAS